MMALFFELRHFEIIFVLFAKFLFYLQNPLLTICKEFFILNEKYLKIKSDKKWLKNVGEKV